MQMNKFGDLSDAINRTQQRRYLVHTWKSSTLAQIRAVAVYLPAAYESDPLRHFPVMYLHDGQNLFDPELSYVKGSTWRAGETADRLTEEGKIEPLILIGVANVGVGRIAEYTPFADHRLGGGEGPQFAQAIVDGMLPSIASRYRVATGRDNTGIGGSSLGGLLSLWMGFHYPEIFGRVAALSPSLWWAKRHMLTESGFLEITQRPRIWLDMGLEEGFAHVRDTDLLARTLEHKGWQSGRDLRYRRIRHGIHSETAWADRFGEVLEFLFPATK